MDRRQFLRGAGGFALALPLLPSLLPSRAFATEGLGGPKRFVCIASDHGGIHGANMYPPEATLTGATRLTGGHLLRHGPLELQPEGTRHRLSPCLSASSSALTRRLADRMNVLRGLDIPFYITHHTGGYLGNYARNDTEFDGASDLVYRPTIDQLLARSTRFNSRDGERLPSLHIGLEGNRSITWRTSDPDDPDAAIVPTPHATSSRALFDALFRGAEAPRGPVVDHVLESYRRLRRGAFGDARRLSAADRARLDDHMDRLHELERRLDEADACTRPDTPRGDADLLHPGLWRPDRSGNIEYHQLYNEVVALALLCDRARVVTIAVHAPFVDHAGDWHGDVVHWSFETREQALVLESQRTIFEEVVLDLCTRLDVDQGNGTTVLDDALVQWVQEAGTVPHEAFSLPVLTFGGAGGTLRTGWFVDYRDPDNLGLLKWADLPEQRLSRPGLFYSQWLATVLQAMGLPHADWGRPGEPGYGQEHYDYWPREVWSDAVRAQSNAMLPFPGT